VTVLNNIGVMLIFLNSYVNRSKIKCFLMYWHILKYIIETSFYTPGSDMTLHGRDEILALVNYDD
jgi:hypothetical protein